MDDLKKDKTVEKKKKVIQNSIVKEILSTRTLFHSHYDDGNDSSSINASTTEIVHSNSPLPS